MWRWLASMISLLRPGTPVQNVAKPMPTPDTQVARFAWFFERRPQLATLLSFIANGTVRYEVLVPGGVSLPAISLSSDIDQVRATNEDGAVSIIAARFIFELAL